MSTLFLRELCLHPFQCTFCLSLQYFRLFGWSKEYQKLHLFGGLNFYDHYIFILILLLIFFGVFRCFYYTGHNPNIFIFIHIICTHAVSVSYLFGDYWIIDKITKIFDKIENRFEILLNFCAYNVYLFSLYTISICPPGVLFVFAE